MAALRSLQAQEGNEVLVQTFWHLTQERNSCVERLCATKLPLNQCQLCQAFCDRMPQKWQECFSNVGKSISTVPEHELLKYFHDQEGHVAKK